MRGFLIALIALALISNSQARPEDWYDLFPEHKGGEIPQKLFGKYRTKTELFELRRVYQDEHTGYSDWFSAGFTPEVWTFKKLGKRGMLAVWRGKNGCGGQIKFLGNGKLKLRYTQYDYEISEFVPARFVGNGEWFSWKGSVYYKVEADVVFVQSGWKAGSPQGELLYKLTPRGNGIYADGEQAWHRKPIKFKPAGKK